MTHHPQEITINKALLRAAIATASWRRVKQEILPDARAKAGDWIAIAHDAGAPLREIASRLRLPLITVTRLETEARGRGAGKDLG